MVVAVAIQLLTELHDGRVKHLDSFLVVFALFFANAFGLLLKVLLGLATLGVLLVGGFFEGYLISIQLCFLILVVVLGFGELLFLLQASLFQSLCLLS